MNRVVALSKQVDDLALILGQAPSWTMPSAARLMASLAWQDTANVTTSTEPTTNWSAIESNARLLPQCPWFVPLNPMQRIISAAVMTKNKLSVDEMTATIETLRKVIRAGHMRRSDDIEVLTALLFLTAQLPLPTTEDVKRMHVVYEHLKLDHWWPTGPEDLPMSALIAMLPGEILALLRTFETAYSSLAEKDEIPGDLFDLVLLAWSGAIYHLNKMMESHQELRTEFILSGIPLGAGDALALSRLAVMQKSPDEVVAVYRSLRQQFVHFFGAASMVSAAECAADTIIFAEDKAVAAIHRAGVLFHLWTSQRNHSFTTTWPA